MNQVTDYKAQRLNLILKKTEVWKSESNGLGRPSPSYESCAHDQIRVVQKERQHLTLKPCPVSKVSDITSCLLR